MDQLDGTMERVRLKDVEEEVERKKEEGLENEVEEEEGISREELVRQLLELKKGKAPGENGLKMRRGEVSYRKK